ncbi:MAG TPA: acyltransferase [Caulobacteraceae bacterium]|jgi:exopolysaccharide production protein ExoZ
MTQRIVSLQVLRFLAASMVALYHTAYLPQEITGIMPCAAWRHASSVGAAGVDIFFVLSGFVIAMTGPLASSRPSGALFVWRRWSRVAPVYFLVSLPLMIHAWVHGGLSWDRMAATFLFWPIMGGVVAYPYIEQGWTLCFEMLFYVSVALLLSNGKLSRNLAIGIGVAATLISLRLEFETQALRFLTNPILLEFGVGFALANTRSQVARAPLLLGVSLLAAGLGTLAVEGVAGVETMAQPQSVLEGNLLVARLVLFGGPATAIVAGAIICERKCGGALAGILAKGGDASYMLYLTHTMTISLVATVWICLRASAPLVLLIPVALASAVTIGVLCHRLIERPVLKDLRRVRFGPAPIAAASLPGGSP